jgi:hypothetical protein
MIVVVSLWSYDPTRTEVILFEKAIRGLRASIGYFRLVRVVLSHSRLMRMMRQKMRHGQSRDELRDDAKG